MQGHKMKTKSGPWAAEEAVDGGAGWSSTKSVLSMESDRSQTANEDSDLNKCSRFVRAVFCVAWWRGV